jgi:hypothetical protein
MSAPAHHQQAADLLGPPWTLTTTAVYQQPATTMWQASICRRPLGLVIFISLASIEALALSALESLEMDIPTDDTTDGVH